MKTPRRILVVRTDRVGDVVLATPLLRAVRRTYPTAYLAALVRPYTRDVLSHNPHLDAVLTDDPASADAGARGFLRQALRLRRQRFDTALLLMPTSRAAWLLAAAGIRTRIGVGRKFYEVVTGMRSVSRHGYVPLRHEADYCLDLGRAIGVRAGSSPEDLATEVFATPAARAAARADLARAGVDAGDTIIALHPSGGGSAPNWPVERWFALATALLASTDARTKLLVTGESPQPPARPTARLVDRRGARSLRALIADLACCDLVVAPSTGPLHLAAGLGVPTVGLYCRLPACAPALWSPQGRGGAPFVCVQPAEGRCPARCPPSPHHCRFDEIAVDAVATAVHRALERRRT